MTTETEVKMGAWPGFELPTLDGLAEDVTSVARPPRTLLAVYYDTADLRLARWGVTIRHRSGDGTGWTVKLPEGDDGPALVRRELTFEGPAGKMPDDALSLVSAYARDAPLLPVARIRTVRTGVDLLDHEGAMVAEVVDDEVSVLHGGRVATRFREVEVELGERPPAGLLETVVARLQAAGAGVPESTPKVIRALGARAIEPAEVAPVALGKKPSAAEVVRHAIASAVVRIMRHDPGVRIGDDPEDVHQARVGTRRLRSDLRTFAPLLDEGWLAPLREELRWLAGALGAVRDADVLIERLRRQAATLPEPDTVGLSPLFRRLAKERDQARAGLLEAMQSRRYRSLLDRLVAAAQDPAFGPAASGPAADVVPGLVAGPWRTLRKAVNALPADPPDAALHRVRVLAKRARYASEAAAPLVGRKASSFATALAGLQTVLGDHHDAVVAEAWLRSAADGADAALSLATGELIGVQLGEAAACRKQWRKAWEKASDSEAAVLAVTASGTTVVQAAGGAVWRRSAAGELEILLVHRPRYDDWTVPKGKLDPDEGHADAALREVEEETGLRCALGPELASTSYRDRRGRPKVVRYWAMTPVGGRFSPTDEVDEVRWLPMDDARALLTYERDQPVLAALGRSV